MQTYMYTNSDMSVIETFNLIWLFFVIHIINISLITEKHKY